MSQFLPKAPDKTYFLARDHDYTDAKATIIKLKLEGASCRTCKHFYHVTSVERSAFSGDDTRCKLKDKEIRHYNICEFHNKEKLL